MNNLGHRHHLPSGKPVTLTLAASQLTAIFEDNYLEGKITIQPKAGKIHQVHGHVDGDYIALWLKDTDGNIVSGIIEAFAEGATDKQALRQKSRHQQ